jgi:hypothetical protein
VSLREIWRSFVLYGLFFLLLIGGWRELPEGESILQWYVIVASAVTLRQQPLECLLFGVA